MSTKPAPQPVALTPYQAKMGSFKRFLAANERKIATAIPNSLKPDRMLRLIVTEAERMPSLLDCDEMSLWSSVIQAAQLGLEVGGVLGEAYLIPYGKKCQLVIGYKGFLTLAYRSGKVKQVDAVVVHAADEFHFTRGTEPRIHHVPSQQQDPGPVTHAYAVVHTTMGGKHFEVMTLAELEEIRNSSPGKNSGPWKDHTEEMYKKTVFRNAFKWAPKSATENKAVALDEQAEAGVQRLENVIDVEVVSEAPPPVRSLEGIVDRERREPGSEG
jgi:recombination protein RecT